jgi:intracellular multiplication protein IcmO
MRRFRGISEHQEVDRNTRRPDTRPILKRLNLHFYTTDGVIAFYGGCLVVALLGIKLPFTGELIALASIIFWKVYVRPAKPRAWNFPYRVPQRAGVFDGSYPVTDSVDPKTKKKAKKYTRGNGIAFLGKEFGTNLEIWAADKDLRTHNLVLGTTGSGKTELLLGIVFNALVQNSGLIYCDGKGDVALYDNVFRLCRLLNREDDILVVNFISGGRDLSGKSSDRMTNTLNPYATSSSSMQNELNISLMDDGGGGGDMWKGRAISFISALSRPLTWLRDRGYLFLDPGAYIATFELPQIERLVWDKQFIGIGDEQFTIKDPDFDEALKPLVNYLATLPGYTKEKKGKQEQKTLEQHGFITMQMTKTFGDLTFTYGHIFRHKLGEIDFSDVVLNRRILLVLLPSLERAPDSLKSLGKLVVGNIKAMMGSSLGSLLEGERRQIIEARPTNADIPFYDILDEYGYYAVLGFAVAPAQARSLGHSITFAAQDFSSLQKASKEEADSTWENTNVRMIGRITSGEESETWRRIRGVAGEAEVDSFGQKEFIEGSMAGTYRTNRDTTTEKVARIAYDDLASQQDGEFHFLIGKKEDSGKRGRVRIIRGRSFYTGMSSKEVHSQLRINHFLKVEPPANINKIDMEGLSKLVAAKLISGDVGRQFQNEAGVEGVKGGVTTTYVAKLFHEESLSGLKLLERGMVCLASLVLRTREDYQQAANDLKREDVPVGPTVTADERTAPAVSEGVITQPKAKVGGLGGSGGETTSSSGGGAQLALDPVPSKEEPSREVGEFPVAPRGTAPAAPVGAKTPEPEFTGERAQSSNDSIAGSVDGLAEAMKELTDGWEQTSPINRDRIAEITAKVEAKFLETVDDEGIQPLEDFEEQAVEVGNVVAEVVESHNKYAEAPIPADVTQASFDELVLALSKVAGREEDGENGMGR